MSLKEKIISDLTASMKAKDANRTGTLRMVKAAVMNEENKRGIGSILTDEEINKILNTLVKQRKEAFEQFSTNGRTELAAKEQSELTVLEEYLPQSASPDEIVNAVTAAISETGAASIKDMGAVMKATLAKLVGKTVDGKLVSETVKAKLG